MQMNERWSNYEAINSVIHLLKDKKLESYKKSFQNFKKSLRLVKSKLITSETNLETINNVIKVLIDQKLENYKTSFLNSVEISSPFKSN